MLRNPIRLFRIFGIRIEANPIWLLLLALIAGALAIDFFPQRFPGLAMATYILMGSAGALGLFLSLLIQEASHGLASWRRDGFSPDLRKPARAGGTEDFTLVLFRRSLDPLPEPTGVGAELRMALAAPVAGMLLGALFYGAALAGLFLGGPPYWIGLLNYLSLINFLLAAFNLLPAFPLDGGRILRATLWRHHRDLARATRSAAAIGSGLGLLLLLVGTVKVLYGAVTPGVWWMLIGLFLRMGVGAAPERAGSASEREDASARKPARDGDSRAFTDLPDLKRP